MKKTRHPDVQEDVIQDTTIEWMVTESELDGEDGIEGIRREVEKLQDEHNAENATYDQNEL